MQVALSLCYKCTVSAEIYRICSYEGRTFFSAISAGCGPYTNQVDDGPLKVRVVSTAVAEGKRGTNDIMLQ